MTNLKVSLCFDDFRRKKIKNGGGKVRWARPERPKGAWQLPKAGGTSGNLQVFRKISILSLRKIDLDRDCAGVQRDSAAGRPCPVAAMRPFILWTASVERP
jgi:hypothetical protein